MKRILESNKDILQYLKKVFKQVVFDPSVNNNNNSRTMKQNIIDRSIQ